MASVEEEMKNEGWDVTTDPLNPQPRLWPVCTYVDRNGYECKTPWVWRRFMSFGSGYVWAWARDCKHKKGDPRMMTKDGEYKP